MKKTVLKQLAQNAKLRMMKSNYDEKIKRPNNVIKFKPTIIEKDQIKITKLDNNAENVLKLKIIDLLNKDCNSIYPLSQIIDYPYYNTLSESDKQRYILRISEYYLKIKNNYIYEKKHKKM